MKYEITLNGRAYEVEVELADPMPLQEFEVYAPAVAQEAPAVAVEPSAAPGAAPAEITDGKRVDAPMPGNILKVNVTAGQAVKEGEVLLILEAMKMENEITAPCSGTVTQVLVAKGATVETGTLLVLIA